MLGKSRVSHIFQVHWVCELENKLFPYISTKIYSQIKKYFQKNLMRLATKKLLYLIDCSNFIWKKYDLFEGEYHYMKVLMQNSAIESSFAQQLDLIFYYYS